MNTFKKRIDELGRIVIPKELRKFYKINNYDELELSTQNDKIIITKSLGIKEHTDKIKKFISFIKTICNFDILIVDNNKIIETTIDNLDNEFNLDLKEIFNNQQKTFNIKDKEITRYIYTDQIIIDSNFLGYIVFIDREYFSDKNLLKNIKNILIDLIN